MTAAHIQDDPDPIMNEVCVTTYPQWEVPHPLPVVQCLMFDMTGQCLLLHRSNEVRSARNVWSIPTGQQDVGENQSECLIREMREEFDLDIIIHQLVGIYENIAGDHDNANDPQYHWVISFYIALVKDITQAVNKEPEKHDQIILVHIDDLSSFEGPHHPTLQNFLSTYCMHIKFGVKDIIESEDDLDLDYPGTVDNPNR